MEDAVQPASSASAIVQGNLSTASNRTINSSMQTPMLPNFKLLPRHYSQCEFSDLVELIGRMLQQLMSINDQIRVTPDKLTRFHSRASPAITVTEYLSRIVKYSSLEKPTLLAAVFYIDLLSRSYPAFSLSSLTVHRFLITAITVASKGLCDAFCTNTHYAKVGGLGVAELNMLELEFLKKVDWKIVPDASVLEAYYQSMISQDPRYCYDQQVVEETEIEMSDINTPITSNTQTLPSTSEGTSPKRLPADDSMWED